MQFVQWGNLSTSPTSTVDIVNGNQRLTGLTRADVLRIVGTLLDFMAPAETKVPPACERGEAYSTMTVYLDMDEDRTTPLVEIVPPAIINPHDPEQNTKRLNIVADQRDYTGNAGMFMALGLASAIVFGVQVVEDIHDPTNQP